jgi:dihydroorotase
MVNFYWEMSRSDRAKLRQEQLTKCGWSSFEGWNLTGWPITTFVNGAIAFDRGVVNANIHGLALQFEQ